MSNECLQRKNACVLFKKILQKLIIQFNSLALKVLKFNFECLFLHSNLHCECSSLKYSSNLSNMQTRRWRLSVVGVLVAGERNRKRKKLKTDRVTTSSESRGLKRLIFRFSFIYSLVKYDLKWWSVCLLILFILS